MSLIIKDKVNDFILDFLEPTDFSSKHEIVLIHDAFSTVNRIFLKFAESQVSWSTFLDVVSQIGFDFYTERLKRIDSLKDYLDENKTVHRKLKSVQDSTISTAIPIFYLNMSKERSDELRRTTKALPDNTKDEKVEKWANDRISLIQYFGRMED